MSDPLMQWLARFGRDGEIEERNMQPRLSPAQLRHLQRYGAGDEGFKNTRSEKRLLNLGFLQRCDQVVRYNAVVTWTIYKARITAAGRDFLARL